MRLPSCGCSAKSIGDRVFTCPICLQFAYLYSPLFEDGRQFDLFEKEECSSVSALTRLNEIDLHERGTLIESIDDGLPF